MISTDLLLKGLAGVAVVGGASGVGVWYFSREKVETLTLSDLAEKVGLSCTKDQTPTETTGVECSKGTEDTVKVKVKRDTKPFEATSITGGKIKVYKTSEGEKYNNDFKFVIEEADVTTNEANNKLEEFETYEIKKEGDDWRLTRKDKDSVLKGKLLGLSGVGTCKLPEKDTETGTCSNLTAEDLKKIKFDGKQDGGNVTIDSGSEQEAANITLKISKVSDAPFNDGGYKFVFETNKNISVPKSSNATISIKKGTNTEFKIKTTAASGAKTLTLEKAWTLDTLGEKVGIATCTAVNSGTGKECGFTSEKVNLFIDAGNHTKGATVKSSDNTKKIKVEEDQEGHNQGFKFYTEGTDGITLENGSPTGTGDKKIEKKETNNNSPTYEIKQQTITGGTKDWYLSKKTTTPNAGA